MNKVIYSQIIQSGQAKNCTHNLSRLSALLFFVLYAAFGGGQTALASRLELTQAQAIARARAILSRNKSACRIGKIHGISAARVKAGWRVTARITMSASGARVAERAVWIVSAKNGASPSNQLTAEIGMGCP